MAEQINTTDLFSVLDIIERRAGLLLLNRNLDLLYCFISGYNLASEESELQIINLELMDKFRLFLKDEFNEEFENTMGWYGSLHNKYGSKEGFEKFFEYLNKFKKNNGL